MAPQEAEPLLAMPAAATLAAGEAEAALLSSVCLMEHGPVVLAACRRAGLTAKAFTQPVHAACWEAVLRLEARGTPAGVAAVIQELMVEHAEDLGSRWGGPVEVMRLLGTVETGLQWHYWLGKVVDFWRARQARWWLTKAQTVVVEKAGDWMATFGELGPMLGAVQALVPEGAETMASRAEKARVWMQAQMAGEVDRSRWVRLPGRLDERFGPLDVENEDFLVLLAGTSSAGKSSLARQIVGDGLLAGQRFAVFLLETGQRMFCLQLAAQRCRMNVQMLREYPRDMQARFAAEYARVEEHLERHLWVWEDVYSIDGIEARSRELARRVEPEGGLHAIVVDYTQIVTVAEPGSNGRGGRRYQNREQEVAALAERLKRLGKSLHVPVLALCQLNREPEKAGRPPRKSDLRESGALEQAADRVMMIWMPPKDGRGVEQSANQARIMVEMLQVKHRNGPPGSCLMWFDRPYTLFTDLKAAEEPAAAPAAVVVRDGKGKAAPAAPAWRPGMRKTEARQPQAPVLEAVPPPPDEEEGF